MEGSLATSEIASTSDDGEGPQFFSGVSVEVSEQVQGDVYVSGQSITISGDISGDVIAAAQTIDITGTIDGNVRLAAQDVSISGEVGRSGTVFASVLNLAEDGSIGDDLVAAARSATIGGDLGRDLVAAVDGLTIDGAVGGDVTYYSDRDATIAEGAVDGDVERIAPTPAPEMEPSPWALFIGWFLGLLYALVALSLITLLAGLLLPGRLTRVTDQLRHAPWKALLVGFVASIVVPVMLVALLITIIGAPLAIAGLLVWLLLTLATFVYGSHFIGRLVFRDSQRPVVMTLVGGLILIFALHVPWLNIVVWLAMVLFGLGAQLLAFYAQRPWRVRPEVIAEPPGRTTANPPVEPPGEPLGEPAVR
ncbi:MULTISPECIES: polymer-forming cytoskeletal protein [unclassified Nesterenkonia]|uniref:polymer-forming cytoskeletal protein n=1 Tax=unclassified Nesterenkonia TaxID=2629769 RepID=UPI001F4D1341|nr:MULTISPECIES: polymer-forming cytoskeletal protein [unclassified Nesterenkonia]MCH8559125.1 polymer-forming cytoskeletal protein [Nesterenkonia sp. DZ6]MCH8563039.1 polymer-forming cytoskeletal protein [Nesterenkonia sp. YGD6]MCH8571460.1 polymer-forming cytoskeletal protein [Nesterenkonia sp. AY15]